MKECLHRWWKRLEVDLGEPIGGFFDDVSDNHLGARVFPRALESPGSEEEVERSWDGTGSEEEMGRSKWDGTGGRKRVRVVVVVGAERMGWGGGGGGKWVGVVVVVGAERRG